MGGRFVFAVSQVRQVHWCCLLCSVLLVVTARQELSGSGTNRNAAAALLRACDVPVSTAASVEVPGPLDLDESTRLRSARQLGSC